MMITMILMMDDDVELCCVEYITNIHTIGCYFKFTNECANFWIWIVDGKAVAGSEIIEDG